MHGWRRPHPYKGSRRRGFFYPTYWGKSVTPDHVYGHGYMEYTVGEANKWNNLSGAAVTENDVTLKANQCMQTVNTTGSVEAPAWHSISLNSPVVSYQGPAGWSGGPPLTPQTLVANPLTNGFNDLNHWARQYKYMSIYQTYLKLTFLPAVTVAANDLPPDVLNLDSLCIWFAFPNDERADNYYMGNQSSDAADTTLLSPTILADPLNLVDPALAPSTMNQDTRMRKIPLNGPNTAGGGRTTLTFKWRLKGPLEKNLSKCTAITTSDGVTRIQYQPPFDGTVYDLSEPTQIPSIFAAPNWRAY